MQNKQAPLEKQEPERCIQEAKNNGLCVALRFRADKDFTAPVYRIGGNVPVMKKSLLFADSIIKRDVVCFWWEGYFWCSFYRYLWFCLSSQGW